MKLILARHGETIENKKGIMQGWLPGHLSALGKKQARLLAKRLKNERIDIIYTSDLARAYDTARIILKYHKKTKLVKERLLREKNHEKETWAQFFRRIKKFYKKLKKKVNKKIILVVAHNGSICLLQVAIHKKKLAERHDYPKMGNTSLSEFEIDWKGKHKTLSVNCSKHLK